MRGGCDDEPHEPSPRRPHRPAPDARPAPRRAAEAPGEVRTDRGRGLLVLRRPRRRDRVRDAQRAVPLRPGEARHREVLRTGDRDAVHHERRQPPDGRPVHLPVPLHGRLLGRALRPAHRTARPGRHGRGQRRLVRLQRHGDAGRTHRTRRDHRRRPVVTSDVPDYGIVGGNPARLIRTRYDEETVARLLAVAWWDWPTDHLTRHIRTIMSGCVDDLEAAAPEGTP